MLKLFQNQGKILRWTMGIILFLVAGSMIITLVPNVFGPAGPGAADILAEVDGVPVTTGDVEVELRQHRANNVPPAAISMIASNTIDALIAERVLFAEAAALGLVPTDEDLAVWIREQLPDVLFPDGKYIGADAYHRFVRQQFRRTVPEFEQEILYNIAISQHLRQLVTDGVSVTEDEVKRRFHEENDSIRIEWAAVDAAGVRGEVEAKPEQLRAYFDANKLRYRHAERRPLKLMTIGPDAAVSEHEIEDAEIDLHYSQNQYRFENPERVKVRHILFMTMGKSDAEAEQARKDAEAVLEELRGGGSFEELAKEHSEDPGNAENGGDLGWVSRGMMDPAFEEASFALRETGEITQSPVKSEFGYHLIRLDDRQAPSVKPLSEVRDVIREDLRAERAQSDRYSLMERAMAAAEQAGAALENAAGELDLPYQAFEAFSRADLPDQLPKASALVEAIFEQPVGQVFTVAEEDTLYIGFVTESVPARDAEYEEVSSTVRADYIDTESANIARQRSEDLAQAAKDASGDLTAAARRSRLSITTTDWIKRGGEIEDLGSINALGEAAFTMTDGELQGPVAVGDRWVVFRTIGMQPADESALASDGDALRQTILNEKRTMVFDYFRNQKVRDYSEQGLVMRYADRIQQYLQSMQNVI